MRSVLVALLAAGLLCAGPADEKPTPRQKARQLLDGAAELVAAAKPDVQVSALTHIADNYRDFDRKKALEYLRQAFTIAGQPPTNASPFARTAQGDLAVMAADIDPAVGVEFVKLIQAPTEGYDPRSFAAARVIGTLLASEKIGPAIELAEYMGGVGAYPFEGATQILSRLSDGDERFAAVFSAAMAAYAAKPDSSFSRMLMRHYKKLPPGMAATALGKILSVTLDIKDEDNPQPMTLSSSRGTATFSNRLQYDLFQVMPLVREIDPKQYQELLGKYAELRSAMDLFPGGGPSVADDRGAMVTVVSRGAGAPRPSSSDAAAEKRSMDAMAARMNTTALINSRAEAALAAAAKDPDKGLDLVSAIPSPPKQAEVLGRIAQSVAENDPEKARHVLSRCISLLEDVKYPSDRVEPWDLVAGAAVRLKDDKTLQMAVDKLLADAAELYKDDANTDRPNRAWHENWPSTQAYRHAVIRTADLHGVDADFLLQKITDPDVNVLARITLAQALLGRKFDRFQTFGGRQHPPQLTADK